MELGWGLEDVISCKRINLWFGYVIYDILSNFFNWHAYFLFVLFIIGKPLFNNLLINMLYILIQSDDKTRKREF